MLNPGTHQIPATPSLTPTLAPAAVAGGATVPVAPTLPDPTTLEVTPGSTALVTPVPDDAAPALDPAAVPATAVLVTVLVGVGVCTTTVSVGGGTTVTTTTSLVAAVDVGSTKPPVSVGTAYGGSNSPNRPHALHGYAHWRTCSGAASTGSQRESTMVAMAVGSAVWGQSVPRSERVSCRVMLPVGAGAMVETWVRSRGRSQEVVEGPVRSPAVLMPTAVGMSM